MPMVGGWKHHRDGHRREILSCDRLWEKIHRMSLPGRGGREMFGRDGATGKACEGDTEYGGIRENEKRRLLLEKSGEAVPFRSGMKWGLKVGERITIPPIYRNVRPPIGRYCAVEKNYSQWGVIAIDGTMMIEPQYSDIEISMKGDVTGTKVSGTRY